MLMADGEKLQLCGMCCADANVVELALLKRKMACGFYKFLASPQIRKIS